LAEAEFLRHLYEAFAEATIVRFRHLARIQRNAEITSRHVHGETLASLAKQFGLSEQRVWRIIQRYG
jgi:hypothetical protein